MAIKDTQGNWLDTRGTPVPPKYIDPIDKKRDDVVTKVVAEALKLEKTMKKSKTAVLKLVNSYLDLLGKEAGKDDWKGNLTLRDFSGVSALEISISDLIRFDERLQMAKTIIDELVLVWGKSSRPELVTIIQQAFNVDKSGRINQAMVLRLLKLKINDPKWEEAIHLIRESIQVVDSRKTMTIKLRTPTQTAGASTPTPIGKKGSQKELASDGDWQTLNLNFSSIECEEL
jgi:hypothetical protein